MKVTTKGFLRNLFPSLVLVIFGIFAAKGLFKYYAFSTHDGNYHIARSFDAIQTLKESHFPLRWAGSLNGKCGVPVYVFFYPLIYYLVFVIDYFFNDVIFSLKIVAFASLTVSPVFFYFWLNEETKNKMASFTGAFLYLFVPYRFSLIYVRFSPEFVSYTILPILLLALSRLLKTPLEGGKEKFNAWLLTFVSSSLGGLFLISHNFAIMTVFPVVAIYFFIKAKLDGRQNLWFWWFLSSLGLAAFFLGPVILEKSNVRLGINNVVYYQDHFPTLRQLVRSKWGYGSSSPGTSDGMSFMLGYAQWIVLALSAIYFLHHFIGGKEGRGEFWRDNRWITFWFGVSLASIFMMLPVSVSVWELFSPLKDLQFPWRFLGVAAFLIAALSTFLLSRVKNKKVLVALSFLLILFGYVGNRNHLLPQPVLLPERYVDFENNHSSRFASTTVNDDILNKESIAACSLGETFIVSLSKTGINNFILKRGNTFGQIVFDFPIQSTISLKINLEFFPGIYIIKLNGQKMNEITNCQGRICLNNVVLKKGENRIQWKIVQSPKEKFFNLISLSSLVVWISFLVYEKFKRNKV